MVPASVISPAWLSAWMCMESTCGVWRISGFFPHHRMKPDMELSCGPSKERSYCGKCKRCVDACPAGALTGKAWYPGIPREEILDVRKCDQWKKEHYFKYHQGHNCGICSAVCPYGINVLKKANKKGNIP